MRRQNALAFLPPQGGRWDDAIILAESLLKCDAWTGTAMRCAVEYQARHCSRPIALGPPKNEQVCCELLALIGALAPGDLPSHFCLVNDAKLPEIAMPSTVILPAQRLAHYTQAEQLADILPRRLEEFPTAAALTIATAFGELTANSLENATTSPVGTIATVAHERHEHGLQVVVSDLATDVPQDDASAEWLAGQVAESTADLRGWAALIAEAERRKQDVVLSVAAGAARLSWRAGCDPEVHAGSQVSGFTAAIEVAL